MTYYWRVRQQDSRGGWSDWSEETSFATLNQPPDQPTNISPADGATGMSLTPTLETSTFSDPDPGDTYAASQWQITTMSGDYSDPVYDSGNDISDSTYLSMASGTLEANTTYYWRVRYQDNHGVWSEWSDETSFSTFTEDTWSHMFVDPWTSARFYVNVIDKTFRFITQDSFDTGVVHDEDMAVATGHPSLGITTIFIFYRSEGLICLATATDGYIDLCQLTLWDFGGRHFYVLYDPPDAEGQALLKDGTVASMPSRQNGQF